jgi:ubiquinone/menaquinone biosynthesis C-methylase UbiE
MSQQGEPTDSAIDAVRRLIMGFRATQMIHVAARLGIADELADGPKDAPAIAASVGAQPRALYRLLRALASLGIFVETPDRRFELTPLAELLKRDMPGSLRNLATLYGEPWVWDAYGRTLHSVVTGLPAFEHVHGQAFFDYLHLHPQAAASFDAGMTAYSEQESAAILAATDFSRAGTLVDVGGGQGALLAAILKAYPQAHGILFDRASVLDRARDVMARAGVEQRCAMQPGSFFETMPEGGDVYLLKSILHNWDDARCVAILKNCGAVVPPGGSVLIIERVVPEGNAPSEAKLFDINMLVMLGALERTAAEYRTILAQAGFDLAEVLPTQAAVSIVVAVPHPPS